GTRCGADPRPCRRAARRDRHAGERPAAEAGTTTQRHDGQSVPQPEHRDADACQRRTARTRDRTMLRVISLGAGGQSTTPALMAAHGEIEPPDCAIFADTGWEPRAVYQHLDWLETQLPFPVHRVSRGNLRDDVLARRNTTGGRFAAVPWHTVNPDGSEGM